MATRAIASYARPRICTQKHALKRVRLLAPNGECVCRCHKSQPFSSSSKLYRQHPNYKDSFGTRLRKALSETKIKWYPIPVGLGIGFIGLAQLYRVNEREKARREEEWDDDGYVKSTGSNGEGGEKDSEGRPKRRKRIKPTGPWCVFHWTTMSIY
jgi:phosphatidylserine decarboxylase